MFKPQNERFVTISYCHCTVIPAESSCPCEKEVFDVTVKVDPAKSPNTKQVALDVYQNVYTSASTFMKKQGMDLRT